eukprot:6478809-Amphidinium_carterae.1
MQELRKVCSNKILARSVNCTHWRPVGSRQPEGAMCKLQGHNGRVDLIRVGQKRDLVHDGALDKHQQATTLSFKAVLTNSSH